VDSGTLRACVPFIIGELQVMFSISVNHISLTD
jgi:hypothetical protein